MVNIRKIAVLGSGVMGSGIAALCANAGFPTLLLDIVPKDAEDRSMLARNAIAKQVKAGGFVHEKAVARVTPGNLEDHLEWLKDVDWIIEAVLEKLEVKQNVYRSIDTHRKPGCIVSSNTSTLPLDVLLDGLPESFASDFMIAHFFNPPRHMRLLEVVKSSSMPRETFENVCRFADVHLGKEVVECKDTPGFIANRIGVYWMTVGLNEAVKLGIDVEAADAAMRPFGIPKTGIFGLYDLIGLDLMPLIAKSMTDTLPSGDAFFALEPEPALLKKLIADGYTGRKGKGGFTRVEKQGEKKIKQVLDLQTGEYRAEKEVNAPSITAAKTSLNAMLESDDVAARFARIVWLKTLHYAASLIPGIADSIHDVDRAMKSGYSWQAGPFELIDRLGVAWVKEAFTKEGMEIPAILAKATASLYRDQASIDIHGAYQPIKTPPGVLRLADIARVSKPVFANDGAKLWDLGDGIACFEVVTKMHAVDEHVLDALEASIDKVAKDFHALVIGSDADPFSAGANLSYFLACIDAKNWSAISHIIKRGQQLYDRFKYAAFPSVAALSGLALGGGCEIVLHCSEVQPHMETTIGLVEVNVGLIPAWGGCKEMLKRHGDAARVFDLIMDAKTSASAEDAKDLKIVPEHAAITMNRARLLADAKARAMALKGGGTPAVRPSISNADTSTLLNRLEKRKAEGTLTPHDETIGRILARVLGDADTQDASILSREHDGFMELIKTPETRERIAHMLKTGKKLGN